MKRKHFKRFSATQLIVIKTSADECYTSLSCWLTASNFAKNTISQWSHLLLTSLYEIETNTMKTHELQPLCLKTTSASGDEISHLR